MGTQWEIVDRRNRRRFDMDKLWVDGLTGRGPLTLAQVRAAYDAGAALRYGAKDPHENDYGDIARRIWAFCEVAGWDVEMFNDAGEDFAPAYVIVDGRCGGLEPFDPDPCAAETAAALARAGGSGT